jgi:DNA-binding HxlR family transcriptional regulator
VREPGSEGAVNRVDPERLDLDPERLRKLARRRWDWIILAVLARRSPRRRTELSQKVRDQDGRHIADGILSVALKRLVDEGLVDRNVKKEPKQGIVAEYSITPNGKCLLGHLCRISEILAAGHDPSNQT